MSRSDEKQAILTTLGLMRSYDEIKRAMQQAATEYELSAALKSAPKEVTILSKDSGVLTEENIEDELQTFFEFRGATEEEQKKYRYNIEEAIKLTTVTSKRTVVRVTNYDGSSELYTLFSRSIEAPEGMTFIEFIPKAVASDASDLHVDGSHEVLVSDPVVRFLRPVYSYYVENDARDEDPVVLPLPLELSEPPSIIGFVAVKLKLDSFERGGWYLLFIGIGLAGVIAGNVYLRKNATSSLPAFTQLTELVITLVEKGNYEAAAKYYKDVETVHAVLTQQEQEQTKELLVFMRQAATVHEFRSAVKHAHTLIELNDVTALGTAYDKAMHHFDSLPEAYQLQEKAAIAALNEALESHITSHEEK
jgi:hypothetical protein